MRRTITRCRGAHPPLDSWACSGMGAAPSAPTPARKVAMPVVQARLRRRPRLQRAFRRGASVVVTVVLPMVFAVALVPVSLVLMLGALGPVLGGPVVPG